MQVLVVLPICFWKSSWVYISVRFCKGCLSNIITDLPQGNIDYWNYHPRLQVFVESGQLDFARFDATKDREIQLVRSGDILCKRWKTQLSSWLTISSIAFLKIVFISETVNYTKVWLPFRLPKRNRNWMTQHCSIGCKYPTKSSSHGCILRKWRLQSTAAELSAAVDGYFTPISLFWSRMSAEF